MRIYYNTSRIHTRQLGPVLYTITNDTITTMYNISNITEPLLRMAFKHQYSIGLKDSDNLQKCPLLAHSFTIYDELFNKFPELLI